jgi:hypothetical protein
LASIPTTEDKLKEKMLRERYEQIMKEREEAESDRKKNNNNSFLSLPPNKVWFL